MVRHMTNTVRRGERFSHLLGSELKGAISARPNGMPRIASQDRVRFRALQDAAGVKRPDGKYFVPHEARNSTVSILLELGVPREVIEAIVGHSELVESYISVSDVRIVEALAALADVLRIEG